MNDFDTYLDYYLREMGFSEAEVEVLLYLALNKAPMGQVRQGAKLHDPSEAEYGIKALSEKGIITSEKYGDDLLFKLKDTRSLEKYLEIKCRGTPQSARENNIKPWVIDKWREITEFSGMEGIHSIIMNPNIPGTMPRFEPVFSEYFNHFIEILPRVDLKVTDVCNLNCIYCCGKQGAGNFTSISDIYGEIERVRNMGFENLLLDGGEVTILKDTTRIVSHAKDMGFKNIDMFTNGLMFYQEGLLEEYIKAGLGSASVHISAVSEGLYERLTQRKNTFKVLTKSLENISKFPELNINVITVINTLNISSLTEIVEYFIDYSRRAGFPEFYHILTFCCIDSMAWRNRDSIVPRMETAIKDVQQSIEIAKDHKYNLIYNGLPFCIMKGYEAHNFDLYVSLVPYKCNKGEGIYDYSFLQTMFTKHERCRECIHTGYCMGVSRGYVKLFGFSEFNPVKN